MPFDPTRTHGLVYGEPGVAFEQDGMFYRPDGAPVTASEPAPEPAEPIAKPAASAPAVEAQAIPASDLDGTPPDRMTNKQLRATVEAWGEEWVSREAALKFLGAARA